MRPSAKLASALLVVLPLAAAGPAASTGTPRDQDGQVILELDAHSGEVDAADATFYAPAGRARLVVDARRGSRGVVKVNRRAVPEATHALAAGGRSEVLLDPYVEHGTNTLAVRLSAGRARLIVPFPTLTRGRPQEAGMDPKVLDEIDGIMASHIGPEPDDRFPGAVVLVARHGVIVKHTAYGHAQTYDGANRLQVFRPMTTDTVFDLASITKIAATTAATMRLVDEGRIELDAPVARYIPEFSGAGKEDITVRHLLTHRSGLWEWQPTYLHADTRKDAIDYVIDLELRYPVGQQRRYSDLGFMLLGEIIERVTGQRIDDYVQGAVFSRLGMSDTGYVPASQLKPRIAATSFGNPYEYQMIKTGEPYPVEGDPDDFDGWRDYTLVGEVNDGNAFYAFEGITGHAGLFSTAHDLAIYGQTILNRGGYDTTRLASSSVVREFTSHQYDRGQGLGFWTTRLSAVEGDGAGGIGHGGFTGTEFMVDPERELVVVMLTNRQHPDRPYNSVFPAWRSVLEKVVDAAR